MLSPDEYRALTGAAGLVERGDRGVLRFGGADRRTYLQGLLTNDVAALEPGTGCYAAMLTPQGRMIADMRVLELGDALLLDTHRSLAPGLRERFDQFIFSEDVAVTDITATLLPMSVFGPAAAVVVSSALGSMATSGEPAPAAERLAALAPFANGRWDAGATPVVVAATDEIGVAGFTLYVEAATAPSLRAALERAGASPVSIETVHVRRIEAGRPAFLADMDEDTIPLEAGIESQAISLTKGCYVGQEVIIRVLHRGHGRVARRLVGLTLDADAAPGDRIHAGGREIGRITSAARSPALEASIALGYVHRDFVEPGTEVTVAAAAGPIPARVARLPLVADQPARS